MLINPWRNVFGMVFLNIGASTLATLNSLKLPNGGAFPSQSCGATSRRNV